MIYYYNPKMLKQHWLKEFMELKLGNLPAQALLTNSTKLVINLVTSLMSTWRRILPEIFFFYQHFPYILLVGSFKLEIIKFCTSRLSTML